MTTPSTPMRIQNSDGASRHTRDVEPTSPSIFQYIKRQKAGGAGTANIAQAFLGKHPDDPDRDYMVRQHVISKSANTLDEFAIVCSDTSNVLAKSEQECVAGLLEREASVPFARTAAQVTFPLEREGRMIFEATVLCGALFDVCLARTLLVSEKTLANSSSMLANLEMTCRRTM
ncbi:hypothetical protein E4U44_004782 [Claviceps purpurea]|nr:hypothetical protein E4U44_004782 [Claviceps purpurea]